MLVSEALLFFIIWYRDVSSSMPPSWCCFRLPGGLPLGLPLGAEVVLGGDGEGGESMMVGGAGAFAPLALARVTLRIPGVGGDSNIPSDDPDMFADSP